MCCIHGREQIALSETLGTEDRDYVALGRARKEACQNAIGKACVKFSGVMESAKYSCLESRNYYSLSVNKTL